jgi:hypothetical protein
VEQIAAPIVQQAAPVVEQAATPVVDAVDATVATVAPTAQTPVMTVLTSATKTSENRLPTAAATELGTRSGAGSSPATTTQLAPAAPAANLSSTPGPADTAADARSARHAFDSSTRAQSHNTLPQRPSAMPVPSHGARSVILVHEAPPQPRLNVWTTTTISARDSASDRSGGGKTGAAGHRLPLPHIPVPTPSGGSLAPGFGGGSGIGLFAALIAVLSLAITRWGRWLRPTEHLGLQPGFVSVLERPG